MSKISERRTKKRSAQKDAKITSPWAGSFLSEGWGLAPSDRPNDNNRKLDKLRRKYKEALDRVGGGYTVGNFAVLTRKGIDRKIPIR